MLKKLNIHAFIVQHVNYQYMITDFNSANIRSSKLNIVSSHILAQMLF